MKASPSTIASTVHDTFQTFILWELDRYGKTTPELFELINLPLAQLVMARNAIGDGDKRQSAGDRDHAIRRRAAVRLLPLREFRASAPLLFSRPLGRFIDMDRDGWCSSCH